MTTELPDGENANLTRRKLIGSAAGAQLLCGGAAFARSARAADSAASNVALAPLAYADNALEPVISANTLGFHYGRHHRNYVDNLTKLVAGTDLANQSLERIIATTGGKPDRAGIYDNAAQAWNHAGRG